MNTLTPRDQKILSPAIKHRDEWDFSPLAVENSQTRQAAFAWELDREVARAKGRPCQNPWPALSPNERGQLTSSVIGHEVLATLRAAAGLPAPEAKTGPKAKIPMLRHVPSDIVIELFREKNAEQFGAITYTFIIDWKQIHGEKDIKKLSGQFAKWTRQNNPEKSELSNTGGRPTDAKSKLLALSCYRLNKIYALEFRLAEILLRNANLVSKKFNQSSMNRFVAKAEHEIERRRYEKDAAQHAINELLRCFQK